MNKNNSTIFLKIMSILIVKKNFKEKRIISKANFTLLLFIFAITFSFLGILNNQKNILADEEIDFDKMECGREIPLGEAMEKTHWLLNELIQELELIYDNANYQIAAAEQTISLADQCNISNCQPVDCGSYTVNYSCCLLTDPIDSSCIEWSTCSQDYCNFPHACTSPWGGRACPQSDIEGQFNLVQSYYEKINASKERVINLIDEDNEFLCLKTNEDVRGGTKCSSSCISNPTESSCPKINTRELVRRKLYLSRNDFDKCLLSEADWLKFETGEIGGRFLFNCPLVVGENFSYYTKTIKKIGNKDVAVCTSLHNWFCCFGQDLGYSAGSCQWISGNTCPQDSSEFSYDYCGSRPVSLMTCCCPDF